MAGSARNQLRDLQKSLYEKAFADAKALSVIGGPTILNYSEKYLNSLPASFTRSNLAELLKAMHRHALALYGDFHTLKQSQRGLIRLLRAYREAYPKRTVTLAMEMFKASDQTHVDAYLEGRMDEKVFLEKIHYQRDWSFPWPHYRAVIEFARKSGIRILGINTGEGGRDSLAARDQFAAKVLRDALTVDPKQLLICLIGEYHLANDHLPYWLTRSVKSKDITPPLRIFTNVDHYYFKGQPTEQVANSEYLRLRENDFCVQNCPPWIKWASYAIWEEMRQMEEVEEEDDDASWYTEEAFDVDSQLLQLSEHLVRFLKLPYAHSELTDFSIHWEPNSEIIEEMADTHGLTSWESDAVTERLSVDGLHYVAGRRTMLLSDLSLNNLAHLAGAFVADLRAQKKSRQSESDKFAQRILCSAAGMVGSKILNPRRKGVDIWSLRLFLREHRHKRLMGRAQTKRDVARAVIAFHDSFVAEKKGRDRLQLSKKMVTLDRFHFQALSQTLGNVLGYALYLKVVSQGGDPNLLRRLFLIPGEKGSPEKALLQLYSQVFPAS